MTLHDIEQRMHSGLWAILPDRKAALRAAISAAIKGEMPMDFDYEPASGSMEETPENNILTIPVNGVLMKGLGVPEEVAAAFGLCDIDEISDDLRQAAEDPEVDTIILDFNTPGGETTGIYELGQLIAEVGQTKNVIGYSSGTCASAGYWLAAKCNEFVCAPSSTIGSVGVRCERYDVSKANEEEGIKVTPFASSPKKLWFDPNYPMSEEEGAWIKSEIDREVAQFKAEVLSNRSIDEALLDASVFDGRTAGNNNFADANANSLYDLKKSLTKPQP